MKKMLFCFDLDGTLWDNVKNSLTPSSIEAIRILKEKGHTVAIATGRPPVLLNGIDQILEIDHIITTNGRYVTASNHVIKNDFIPSHTVTNLIAFAGKHKIPIGFQSKKAYTVFDNLEPIVRTFNRYWGIRNPDNSFTHHKEEDILQVIFYLEGKVPQDFYDTFENLALTQSCPYGYDVNTAGGLKDAGVKALARYLKIPKENIVAFGDADNDVALLKYAGLGIAMGQAKDHVKAAADFTTLPIDQDGILHALKHFNYI